VSTNAVVETPIQIRRNMGVKVNDVKRKRWEGTLPLNEMMDGPRRRRRCNIEAACIAAAVVFGISLTDGSAAFDDTWGLRPTALASSTMTLSQHEHGMCAASDLGGYIRPTSSTILGTGGREGNAASTMIFDGETDRRWRTELFSVIAVTAMRGEFVGLGLERDSSAAYVRTTNALLSMTTAVTVSSNMEQIAIGAICDCVFCL